MRAKLIEHLELLRSELFSHINNKAELQASGLQFLINDNTEAKSKAESLGARVSSMISASTGLLIAGTNPGSKYEKAKSLNIQIVDEESWIKMLEDHS